MDYMDYMDVDCCWCFDTSKENNLCDEHYDILEREDDE